MTQSIFVVEAGGPALACGCEPGIPGHLRAFKGAVELVDAFSVDVTNGVAMVYMRNEMNERYVVSDGGGSVHVAHMHMDGVTLHCKHGEVEAPV